MDTITTHAFEVSAFAASHSLYNAVQELCKQNNSDLSGAYDGGVGLMQECIRIGAEFDVWADSNVEFDRMTDCWPYLMDDRFGAVAVEVAGGELSLKDLGSHSWPLIAQKLGAVLLTDVDVGRDESVTEILLPSGAKIVSKGRDMMHGYQTQFWLRNGCRFEEIFAEGLNGDYALHVFATFFAKEGLPSGVEVDSGGFYIGSNLCWTVDEISEDPELVVGAILGALQKHLCGSLNNKGQTLTSIEY
jgi:hypothetical protein